MPPYRVCEGCGVKLPPHVPRKRQEPDGPLLCDGCRNGRPGRPRAQATADYQWIDPRPYQVRPTPASEAADHAVKVEAQEDALAAGGWPRAPRQASIGDYDQGYQDGMADAQSDSDPIIPGDSYSNEYVQGYYDAYYAYTASKRSPKLAHDGGQGDVIYHCPFCLSGPTRYITQDGIKTFAETVGTEQWVLSGDPNDRVNGRWVLAHIHEFGEQPLLRITLRRNQQNMVVEATPEHRWLVKSNQRERVNKAQTKERINRKGKPRDWRLTHCANGHELIEPNIRVKKNGTRECLICARNTTPVKGVWRATDRYVLTKDLRSGMRLSHLRPSGVKDLVPNEAGIRHGIVFGDGTALGRYATVTLWGEKDKQLVRYFPGRNLRPDNTSSRVLGTGIPGVRVTGNLWAWMKALPQSDDPSYLYGWLAGYFAADGSVSKEGQVSLASANLSNLEAARDIVISLGISVYSITMQMRAGFPGREPSAIYEMSFVTSTLNEDFFLVEQHRDRYRFRDLSYERFGWTVVSIEETGKVEPVYCAVVPGTHTFTLEGNIWTGNCGSGQITKRSDGSAQCSFCNRVFTVQVQPEQSGQPQTINGQPVKQPGMPGDHTEPPPFKGIEQPAVDDSFTPPAEPVPDVSGIAGAPAFIPPDNGQKAVALYLNSNGYALPEKSFIRHLAIRHADDPGPVIDQIRGERKNV